MKRKKHVIINKDFIDAVKQGNLDEMQILIEEGADINTIDEDGWTALHYAASNGYVDVVKFLLEEGTDIDPNTCEHVNGNTSLHEASKGGHLNVAQYLMDNGANIDAKNHEGKKPIHIAAESGHKNIVRFFLSKNTSIDDPDAKNWTPLHYATSKLHLDLMRYLVHKGANIKRRTYDGLSPLCIAAQRRPLTVVSEEVTDSRNLPEMNNEIIRKNRGILDFLIAKDGGINDANEIGLVPLHYAVMPPVGRRIYYIVEKLVDAGAKADMPDYTDGKTPLHYACHKNYFCAVEKMVETKPNLDIQDDEGNTPLHLASKQHNTKIMKCLLEAGARSDIKDNEGCTVLFYYIFNFVNYEIAYNEENPLFAEEILGKIDNFIDIGDDQKKTAAHIAVEGECDIEFLKLVLQKQKDINIEDMSRNTVLNNLIKEWFNTRNAVGNILSKENFIEGVRLLINNGAYLKMIDCQRIIVDPSLRNTLFTDVKLCAQSIVNKFNNKDLPILYGFPRSQSESLPPIEKMKVTSGQIRNIEQAVETKIKNEGYCDTSKMIPTLTMLSLEAYNSRLFKFMCESIK